MKFGCTGIITKITFAALETSVNVEVEEENAELQLWREDGDFQYRKVDAIPLSTAEPTEHLNIYELQNFTEPMTFRRGEVIGLYLPSMHSIRWKLQFKQTSEDDANSPSLSYSSHEYRASNNIFSFIEHHVIQDFDSPLMIIETGEGSQGARKQFIFLQILK